MLAQLTVSNLDDAGAGSLRDAIAEANATVAHDEIVFSVEGVIGINSQLPTIVNPLTITGPGPELLTIDAQNGADGVFATGDGWRIFLIYNGNSIADIDVTLSGLTITGGDTPRGIDDTLTRNGQAGGAIGSLENLTVTNAVITGNATGDGGNSSAPFGIGGSGGNGGGIFAAYGDLTIQDSTISDNRTGTNGVGGIQDGRGGSGGGISANGIEVAVINSVISGNETQGSSAYGGGISSAYGDTTITGTTVDGNSTEGAFSTGGGVAHRFGNLTVTASTISNNVTQADSADGAGLFARINEEHGVAEIINSTISNNVAMSAEGGGIANWSHTMNIVATTITQNTAPQNNGSGLYSFGSSVSTVNFYNTVVSGNTNEDLASSSVSHPFESLGFNLIGSSESPEFIYLENFVQPGDVTGVTDPELGPLADNGGLTHTHVPLPGSPLIDLGDPEFMQPPQFDQRGAPFERIVNGRIDIGAVEAAATSADFDGDDDVDGDDLLQWQRGFPAVFDASDLQTWESNYGQTLATTANASAANAPAVVAALVDAAMAMEEAGKNIGRQSANRVVDDVATEHSDSESTAVREIALKHWLFNEHEGAETSPAKAVSSGSARAQQTPSKLFDRTFGTRDAAIVDKSF